MDKRAAEEPIKKAAVPMIASQLPSEKPNSP
jgi:hypothetical protein